MTTQHDKPENEAEEPPVKKTKVEVPRAIAWSLVETKINSRLATPDGCRVLFVSRFLSPAGIHTLRSFLDAIPDNRWSSGMSCFGHMVPRLIRWYGPAPYRFAGRNWDPHSYEAVLLDLQTYLEQRMQELEPTQTISFKSCLVNKYRSGTDSISKHSDNEKEFGPDPSICSVSLGTTRTFYMQNKKPKSPKLTFPLSDGSVLLMTGKTQELYVHWIDKEPHKNGVRYNLTFRPYAKLG